MQLVLFHQQNDNPPGSSGVLCKSGPLGIAKWLRMGGASGEPLVPPPCSGRDTWSRLPRTTTTFSETPALKHTAPGSFSYPRLWLSDSEEDLKDSDAAILGDQHHLAPVLTRFRLKTRKLL